ncbi:MAG: YkgB family protein [Scandinavium sp.]|uniref:YkgB family protein n=1 Tax=Scandinavium sp. TaxID=2830653 RepID=UPI003F3D0990
MKSQKNEMKSRDVHILRFSLVLIFFFFGYAKWFEYEANGIALFVANSPLMSWMHAVLGLRGTSNFLGAVELAICALLLIGFRVPLAGLLGAAGSTATFGVTLTFLFTTPGSVVHEAGGFPALSSTAQFLLKDAVLLATSVVLLRHELSFRQTAAQKA